MPFRRIRRATSLGLAALVVAAVAYPAAAQDSGWGLDDTFGSNGATITDLGTGLDAANDVAIQADGKIVVGGYKTNPSGARDFALVRYNPDGTLDNGFGHGGVATLDFFDFSTDDIINALAIYPPGAPNAGEIVAVGQARAPDNIDVMAVARFATDGTLDKRAAASWGFAPDNTPFHAYGNAAAIRSNGTLVVAGEIFTDEMRMAVAVFDSELALHPGFDSDGRKDFDLAGGLGSQARGVALYPSNGLNADDIVLVGSSARPSDDIAIVKLNSDGSHDFSFHDDGELTISHGTHSRGLAVEIQPDAKIVVAGVGDAGSAQSDFLAARVTEAGIIDQGFGQSGTGLQTVDFGGSFESAFDVKIQPDGRIVMVGAVARQGSVQIGLTRLTAAGGPDSSFGGNDHRVIAAIGAANDQMNALALASNGAIVTAGTSQFVGSENWGVAVARFDGEDGVPPPSGLSARMTNLRPFQLFRDFGIAWSATGGSDEVLFDLRVKAARYYERKLGSPKLLVTRSPVVSGTATVGPGAGETVCYQVRAHDGGQTSAWSEQECTGIPLDDKALGASGSWTRKRNQANFYDRTWSGSLDKGAELFIGDVFAKQVAVMVVKCAGCGVMGVFVDGVREKKISLQASSTVSQNVLIESYPDVKKRDIEIRVLSPGRNGVFVDAVGISLR